MSIYAGRLSANFRNSVSREQLYHSIAEGNSQLRRSLITQCIQDKSNSLTPQSLTRDREARASSGHDHVPCPMFFSSCPLPPIPLSDTFWIFLYSSSSFLCISNSACRCRLMRCRSSSRSTPACSAWRDKECELASRKRKVRA